MEAEEVLKVAAMVKVTIIAGIRKSLKAGKSIENILDYYEYSNFALKEDELLLVPPKRDKR